MRFPFSENRFVVWLAPEGLKDRAELLVNIMQGTVVQQQSLINFGKSFEDGSVCHKVLAQFNEGSYDIYTHSNRAWAVKDVGSHESPVLGKRVQMKKTMQHGKKR